MILSSNNISSHFHSDQFLLWSLRFLALVAGSLLLLVVVFLAHEAWPAFQQLGLTSFFTDDAWYPTENLYLLTPMLWGTLWATLGSIMLAAPIGILSALFIQYYAPPFLAAWIPPVNRTLVRYSVGRVWTVGTGCPRSNHRSLATAWTKLTSWHSHSVSHDPSHHHPGGSSQSCSNSRFHYSQRHSFGTQSMVHDSNGDSSNGKSRNIHGNFLGSSPSPWGNHGDYDGLWQRRPNAITPV